MPCQIGHLEGDPLPEEVGDDVLIPAVKPPAQLVASCSIQEKAEVDINNFGEVISTLPQKVLAIYIYDPSTPNSNYPEGSYLWKLGKMVSVHRFGHDMDTEHLHQFLHTLDVQDASIHQAIHLLRQIKSDYESLDPVPA